MFMLYIDYKNTVSYIRNAKDDLTNVSPIGCITCSRERNEKRHGDTSNESAGMTANMGRCVVKISMKGISLESVWYGGGGPDVEINPKRQAPSTREGLAV
jgi:hypothetical protein